MKISISQVKHKNLDALLIESDLLALIIIPESGAKIQGIYRKGAQKELLYQSGREEFQKAVYGARFDSGDFSEFDEVFPSIDECFTYLDPGLAHLSRIMAKFGLCLGIIRLLTIQLF